MLESPEETCVKGAETVLAISYAGSGMPCLAKADDAEYYYTYLEPHTTIEELV